MDGDICYDVVGQSGWTLSKFTFQENLTVPCEFGEDSSIQTVFVQTCFAWRTAGNNNAGGGDNVPCDGGTVYPGTPSKCTCSFIDIWIPIPIRDDPSSSPTESPAPSQTVNSQTSTYLLLSLSQPSDVPSISSQPSSMPLTRPSLSTQLLSHSSLQPSTSSAPSCSIIRERVPNPCTTGEPYFAGAIVRLYVDRLFVAQNVTDEDGYYEFYCFSGEYQVDVEEPDCPSLMPSTQNSAAPSVSSKPSLKPSESPSLSSNPSSNSSQSPSSNVSQSQSPSTSSKPTCDVIRDRVPHPCDESSFLVGAEVTLLYDRIEFKTVTDQDGYYEFSCLSLLGDYEIRVELPDCTTFQPSLQPTVSFLPSTQASNLPSLSTIPSSQPSQRPSVVDTEAPSISLSPTSQPTVYSQLPSSIPSILTSLSTNPTLGNTHHPSSSKVPSSRPSQIPTFSQLPSSIPSVAPSLSSKPSLGRTQRPSTSIHPSTHPSSSPSLSGLPSSSSTGHSRTCNRSL